MAPDPARRSRAAAILLTCCLLLTGVLGACGSSDGDSATARRDRVETRLRATYSAAQARCVLARLDGSTVAALDRNRDLSPSSAAFRRYSAAVRACVVPDATTTTSRP